MAADTSLFGISGLSTSTFQLAGSAASDLFSGISDTEKANADLAEAQNYGLAATLAGKNEQYTEEATAIKQMQADRQITQTLGAQRAETAASGFKESGSALDVLRSSAEQGALQKVVLGQQGLITEASYQEQEQTYTNMQNTANQAASTEKLLATGSNIMAGISALGAIGTLLKL